MALKIRVQKPHMALALNWYNQELWKRFGPVVLSEAQRETMRQDFAILQKNMAHQEKTNCWLVPLEISFKDDGTYETRIIDESNLLYLE